LSDIRECAAAGVNIKFRRAKIKVQRAKFKEQRAKFKEQSSKSKGGIKKGSEAPFFNMYGEIIHF
jgi:hypothetical protein